MGECLLGALEWVDTCLAVAQDGLVDRERPVLSFSRFVMQGLLKLRIAVYEGRLDSLCLDIVEERLYHVGILVCNVVIEHDQISRRVRRCTRLLQLLVLLMCLFVVTQLVETVKLNVHLLGGVFRSRRVFSHGYALQQLR